MNVQREHQTFSVLMIDPPWPQHKGGTRKVRPKQFKLFTYPVMQTTEIFQLLDTQIFPLTCEIHCVFMWVIEKYLIPCESHMLKRGYRRHCRLIWDKGNGIAPAFTIRFAHEYLIWYYKRKLLPVSRHARGKYTTVMRECSRQHSRKPEAAFSLIEQLYPGERKMDVFSREYRNGWEQFGNQCSFFNHTLIKEP